MHATQAVSRTWLTTAELAAYIGRSRSTIERLHRAGEAPPHYRIGGQRLYDVAEVEAWLAACRQDGERG